MSHRLVSDAAALASLARDLAAADWLALDTEFVREKTYFPQPCLLQVATPQLVACVDVLAIDDLTPLLDLLYDPARTKVLHAGGQDMEVFQRLRGPLPGPVFDTQLAAAALGYDQQIGYASLIENELGVALDKSQTRTDWSRRPLSQAQLEYAADDVRHLCTLYLRLRERLEQRGRLHWLDAEHARLIDPARYAIDAEGAWRRVKGHRSLRGSGLAILAALASWREHAAVAADRPRRWILGDEVLLEIARRAPADTAGLAETPGLPASVLRRHGDALLECVRSGRARPRADWPQVDGAEALEPAQARQLDAAMARLRRCAEANEIAPALLATRRDLERMVRGERDLELLQGWKAELLGRALLEWLDAGAP